MLAHVRVLHEHLGQAFTDTVLVNIAEVPRITLTINLMKSTCFKFAMTLKACKLGCRVISNSFLSMKNGGAYHDTELG